MPTKIGIVAMGLLSFIFGACSKHAANQPAAKLPEITAGGVEGFVDLDFHVAAHERKQDGSVILDALGLHQGQEVAIRVVLAADWERTPTEPELAIHSYLGSVSFHSLGKSSDSLVQIVDRLYETKSAPTAMRAEVKFQGWSLEGEPGNLDSGPTKIKLFYEPDNPNEDVYGELYLNIDLANRILEIHEKDPDYRSAIINALGTE